MKEPWQPAADLPALKARAELLKKIRHFFAAREVLEVETPLLAFSAGSDLNLDSMQARYKPQPNAREQKMYLHTSPEFAMKRLLASGSGSIFQICKVFRNGESGKRHNPEFTMLEWYRTDFDHYALMDEVEALMQDLLLAKSIERISYQNLFRQYLDIDPFQTSLAALEEKAKHRIDLSFSSDDKTVWLDLLYTHLIEPQLQDPVFIYNFPADQAALAKTVRLESGEEVALRFELVIKGLEIANGYYELADVAEQAHRFKQELELRKKKDRPQYPVDENFLAALAHGLPDCAGVAIGLDRVLMLMTGTDSIEDVLAFPFSRLSDPSVL